MSEFTLYYVLHQQNLSILFGVLFIDRQVKTLISFFFRVRQLKLVSPKFLIIKISHHFLSSLTVHNLSSHLQLNEFDLLCVFFKLCNWSITVSYFKHEWSKHFISLFLQIVMHCFVQGYYKHTHSSSISVVYSRCQRTVVFG